MSKYQQFIFKDWSFDKSSKQLSLRYSYDNVLDFEETYRFDFEFTDYFEETLERAVDNLFFMAGVSYYKMYLAPEIKVEKGYLDQLHADIFGKTYQKGLGEFFYVNSLDPNLNISFPVNAEQTEAVENTGAGMVVGVGGGKDSLVSIELLRGDNAIKTWSMNHRTQLEPLVQEIGTEHLWVKRTWDPKIAELNSSDAYNGHVPISAILACVGSVVAVLSGSRDVVVSNENSANEPTLNYRGTDINHQYSKSSEFEVDFQRILNADFGDSLRYYSLLRPLSELRIAELFANLGFEKYKETFSSCNRAFTQKSNSMFWCGECPKCAFTFLILTPFVGKAELEKLFGKNLLFDPELELTYRQLLGIEGDKPLECIGEIQESRLAMMRAQQIYPELNKYRFDLNENYDYLSLSPDLLPEDMKHVLSKLG